MSEQVVEVERMMSLKAVETAVQQMCLWLKRMMKMKQEEEKQALAL